MWYRQVFSASNTKPIKFLQFCCATPSASVIGVEPTPFSLGSLAKISEIFLGWYKVLGGAFFALCVYGAGDSASIAADSFKVGDATYSVVIQQPLTPLVGLGIHNTSPQKIVGFDRNNKVYSLEALIGTLVLTPLKDFVPVPQPLLKDKVENSAVSYGKTEVQYAYFADVVEGAFSPILGKLPVGRTLVATLKNGGDLRFSLPAGYVYENTAPVVIDLNNDGLEEVVATETNTQTGTSVLGLYIPVEGRLKRMANSPALPQGHWVDALGTLDWQEDGKPSILAIEAPNINGFLQFYGMRDGKMESVRREYGYSSRIVGTPLSQTILLADMDDNGTQELMIPRNSMDALAILSFTKGLMTRLYETDLPAPIASAFYIAYTAPPENPKRAVHSIAFFLRDGQIALITRVQKAQ
jgi:hypothetical protein